ncbi:MAG TPA: secretion protein HlyD [Pirellulales bacterium]
MSTAKRDAGDPTAKSGKGTSTSKPGQDTASTPAPTAPTGATRDAPAGASTAAAPPVVEHRSPIRFVLPALLIAAAAGGGYAWYRFEYSVGDSSHLVIQGNIDVRQVNLAFKVDGRIASLAVDEGDTVTAEQVIATLDKKYFEDDLQRVQARRASAAAALARLENGSRPEEISSAKAQVAEQHATVARAQQDFDRAERLVNSGAVSRETFDQTKSALAEAQARLKYAEETERMAVIGPRQEDIDAGKAQLADAEAAVVQSERRLSDSELFAPSDGIILTRAREKGAIVAAGETVFTLTLASPVWVRTYVNERDLGRIRPGMLAEVRTDTAPDKPYQGRIGFISPTAEFTPKTVETRELRTNLVYRLRVVVDNPNSGLRQGMPVSVTLNLDGRE